MTSHELARHLLERPDLPVVMSKDPEGNLFRPFDAIGEGFYLAGDLWEDDPDEPIPDGCVRSVVLWP